MKKMLIVTGSGGHATESLLLYEDIKKHFNCEFLLEKDDPLTEKKLTGAKIYKTTSFRGKKEWKIVTVFRGLYSAWESFWIFLKARPDIILSAGPGIAIPISYYAKLFGKKVIFIESWSRVTTKSYAGAFIYPIANLFIVQWPELKEKYKKAKYLGRLA